MDEATSADERHEALAFLLQRIDYERQQMPYRCRGFELDRMRRFLELLGNPQDGVNAVHVAGTKGKGSTAAMIAAVLTTAGYHTGLFTSPHIERLEERLVVDGRICTGAELVELMAEMRPVVERMDRENRNGEGGPTYFEMTTALAWLFFARQQVDLAVMEVGLGGRLDSTNICRPVVSVITSISFDHMRQLGNTLAAIAGEKAGIIKPGVPVVSGVRETEPAARIRSIAAEREARLFELERDYSFDYHRANGQPASALTPGLTAELDYIEPTDGETVRINGLAIGLLGRHQAANASVAIATLRRLIERGYPMDEADVRRGLADVRCPARVEIIRSEPTVIVDAAHNAASVAALISVLEEIPPAERRWLLFATSADKDVTGMLSLLIPAFDEVTFTRYLTNPRAVDPEELRAVSSRLFPDRPCRISPDPESSWRWLVESSGRGDLICVTGSFFLAAEVRVLAAGAATQWVVDR